MAKPRANFTLSSLLLLVACISVVLAATRSAVPRWQDDDLAAGFMAAGGTFGAIAGTLIGISSRRYLLGSFAGFFVGAITGMMAGAQLAAPPDILTTAIGVVVLLAIGFALRPKIDRKDPGDNDEAIVGS